MVRLHDNLEHTRTEVQTKWTSAMGSYTTQCQTYGTAEQGMVAVPVPTRERSHSMTLPRRTERKAINVRQANVWQAAREFGHNPGTNAPVDSHDHHLVMEDQSPLVRATTFGTGCKLHAPHNSNIGRIRIHFSWDEFPVTRG